MNFMQYYVKFQGKLPSDNANPQSYAHLFGRNCYNFFSQRRFYDKNDISYVGD